MCVCGACQDPDSGSPYAAAVLADRPIAYYRLNEASGTLAQDSSGNHLDGTYGALVSLSQPTLLLGAAAERAVRLDGLGGLTDGGVTDPAHFIRAPANQALQPQRVSVEAWIRARADQTTNDVGIVSYGEDENAPFQSYILRLEFDAFHWQVAGASVYQVIDSNAPFRAGAVYHLVGTFDGSQLTLYVNGDPNVASATTGPLFYPSSEAHGLGIGHRYRSDQPVFDGELSQVALYDTPLSAERVLAHYDAGTCF